jgi:hypothetical protein
MAISNVSSGLRPGVCTSTTRPQAPFEGQMIYETDTNRVLVWDNAAWVMIADTDQPPGLQFITEITFTNQSFVQLNDCFLSEFNNFSIKWQIRTSSASDYFYRFTSGGTAITENYFWNRSYGYSTSGAGTGFTYGDLLSYSYLGTSLHWGGAGSAEISLRPSNPFGITAWSRTLNGHSSTGNNSTPYGQMNTVRSGQIGSNNIDGIYVSTLGAATITGTIEIFGYRN